MKTLLFVGLLGVFAYHCQAIGHDFKGASMKIKRIFDWSGSINYLMFIILLVLCFWHFPWWMPIIVFFASTVVGGLTAIFFQKSLIGNILSLILVEVFYFLSCFSIYLIYMK